MISLMKKINPEMDPSKEQNKEKPAKSDQLQKIEEKFFSCRLQKFNTDYFIEYLGKHATICGQTNLGTCVLLKIGLHL